MLKQMATTMRPSLSRMQRQCGDIAVLLIGAAGGHVLLARDLELLADVVEVVEDGVVVRDVFDDGVGQHHTHAAHEAVPIVLAVEVIDHEKSAARDEVAEPLGFGVGEGPVGDADGVDPRVVPHVVVIDIDDVEGRGRIDAGETAEGDEAIVVGAREVLRPSAAESAISVAAAIAGVVAEAAEEEFGRDGQVGLVVGLKTARALRRTVANRRVRWRPSTAGRSQAGDTPVSWSVAAFVILKRITNGPRDEGPSEFFRCRAQPPWIAAIS